jgi:hypothetical protein
MAIPTSKIALSSYPQQANKAYIAVLPFNGKVFSYSTYMDSSFNTRGSLVANTGFIAGNSKSGRVLHANGKFLNTGTHPDVTKYYIGIYDPVTGLNGFIDPTDPVFAPYDANLPSTYNLGTSGTAAPPLGGVGQLLDVGVEGTGTQGSAGATVAFANGETIGSVTLFNGSTAVTITSSAITTSSKIFTTLVNRAAVVAHCITALSAGSFTVTFSSAVAGGDDVLQFMIVNTSRQ